MVNHFWQGVDTILEDVSVTETIAWCFTIILKTIAFQCSKNYGTPTRVFRLQVASNMVHRFHQSQRKLTVALGVTTWWF